jgi:glutathione S-transferase
MPFISQLLLAGLFYPITSASFGVVNLVGRQLYASGYTAKGADGRLYGYMLISISQLSMCGMGIFGGLKMAGLFGK